MINFITMAAEVCLPDFFFQLYSGDGCQETRRLKSVSVGVQLHSKCVLHITSRRLLLQLRSVTALIFFQSTDAQQCVLKT